MDQVVGGHSDGRPDLSHADATDGGDPTVLDDRPEQGGHVGVGRQDRPEDGRQVRRRGRRRGGRTAADQGTDGGKGG